MSRRQGGLSRPRSPVGLGSTRASRSWAAACDTRWPRPAWLAEAPPRVDPSGVIRVHTLTEETGDDATIALRASPLTPPLTRSPSTRPHGRGVRRSSSHRPGRRPSLATARGHPRGIERSRWQRRSAGAAGSRCQGPIVRAGWRTRASATRPSSAMAFAPGVQPPGECGRPRLCDPELADRPRPTRVISPRPVRILSVGLVRARHDSCTNAAARRWLLTDPMARSHPWPRDR